MTGPAQIRTHATNAFEASRIILRDCLTSAGTTALYAALMEAPVTALENYVHYRKGRKTGEEALSDAAKDIKNRAIAGGIIGFTVTAAIALSGAGPLLITLGPIMRPIGITLYAYSALKRISSAMQEDIPLQRVAVYYCSPRCHTAFAYENGRSALMRWDQDRIPSKTA